MLVPGRQRCRAREKGICTDYMSVCINGGSVGVVVLDYRLSNDSSVQLILDIDDMRDVKMSCFSASD